MKTKRFYLTPFGNVSVLSRDGKALKVQLHVTFERNGKTVTVAKAPGREIRKYLKENYGIAA